MINTQYINLNMIPSGVMPVLYCSQYDIGRPLGVVVYNGSESVDLSSYTCTIEATRTDKTSVTAAVTTSGNIGVFETTATMTNQADTYKGKLVLTDGNGKRVASLAFVLVVTVRTMDEDAEEIEEDASLYQQYTGTVQTIIASIRADLAAEITARQNAISTEASTRAAAVSAEAAARQSADNTLQSNINAEASTRATQDASLQSQIDQLIAPSGEAPSAAEVENARIGSDGTVYPTLGDAIRTQNSLLKSQIEKYNCFDILANLARTNGDHNGITYTWTGGKCTCTGTTTGQSTNTIFYSANSLPDGIEPGHDYYVKFNSQSGNIKFQCRFVINGTEDTTTTAQRFVSDGILYVPSGAEGMRIRLTTPAQSGLVLNETVEPIILVSYTDKEMTDMLEALSGSVVNIRELPDGTDLDTIDSNIVATLISSRSYVNAPFTIGTIFNIVYSPTISVQFGFQFTTGELYYRRKSTTWGSWIHLTTPDSKKYIARGVLADNSDLDDVVLPGYYVLQSNYTYSHSPIVSSRAGVMIVMPAFPSITVQIVYDITTGSTASYIRSGRNSSLVGRAWVQMTFDDILSKYKTTQKYVAFGDSITWGAVWNAASGDIRNHRVKEEWRIPTRIALATGMINNFSNEAIGGIGYLKQLDGQNLVEQISDYDFTGVELVTIMAGANDKASINLGTYEDSAADTTICGAIKSIIASIAASNPKTQIIIIQPTPSGVNGNNDDVWSTIPTGWKWSMNQFDAQVSQLCKNEHVGYLNWNDSTYCRNWENVGYNYTTGPNYTHPTDDFDYCILGDFIAGKVSSLFKSMN